MNSDFDGDAVRKRQRMSANAMNNMSNVAGLGNMDLAGYNQANAGFFYGNQLPLDGFQAAHSALSVFPVVKLRGLPYSAAVEDILMFFSGLEIIDVFLPGETGRASQGDAYVVFSSPLYIQFALQRNGQRMGKRWIEVYKVSRLAYCEAVVASAHNPGGSSQSQQSQSQSQAHQQSAMVEQNPNLLETKKDEVHTPFLKMLGLPFSATIQEIISFFSGFSVVESSIQIVKNADGRPTGTAFVEFSSTEEAKAAMSRHKENMGNRYIELFGSSREQAENEIHNPKSNTSRASGMGGLGGGLGAGLGNGLGGGMGGMGMGGFGFMGGLGAGMGGMGGGFGVGGGMGSGGGYTPRPGDWLCPDEKCGTNNFSSRQQCFRCGTPRPK